MKSLIFALLARPRQYQPAITRLPSLILLFTLTLALIALTELACRRLPARNSEAFAVLDLKRSLRETSRILARDLSSEASKDAADEPAFLPLEPSSVGPIPNSVAASAAESEYLPLNLPSASNPSPISIDVAAQTSIKVPDETSAGGSGQPSIDILIRTAIDDPTQTSVNIPIGTSIDDPISSPIDVLTQSSFDVSVPGSFPTEVPATSVYLPLEPSASLSVQRSFPQTADEHDAATAGSVDLPLETSGYAASPPESDYIPLDSPTTYTSPLKPGYPVPSVYLPLVPTAASESVDNLPTSLTMIYITAQISDYLPLGPQSTYLDVEPSLYLPLRPTKPAGSDDGVFGDESSDVSLEPTPTFYSTPDDSAYLPLGPTATHSTPEGSAYLPLGPQSTYLDVESSLYLPLHPTKPAGSDDSVFGDESSGVSLGPTPTFYSTPDDSAYLPLSPTATYSTPESSAYLPLDPTETYRPAPSESEFLPLGPSRLPSTSRDYQPYIKPSLYLPLGPEESAEPNDPVVFGDPTDYLPLSPIATALPSSYYLPLDPIASVSKSKDPVALLPQSEYLPVVPKPKSQLYLPVSDYLPLGSDDEPATVDPMPRISKPLKPGAPAETAYLPLEASNSQIENIHLPASIPAASAFLPLAPGPTASGSAYLPLLPNVPDRSAYLPLPADVNPADPSSGPAGVAILPFPPQISESGLAPAQPKNKDKAQNIGTQNTLPLAVDPSGGERINAPVPTGVFEGERYSLGANGEVVIAGKTFDRSSPTTAVLDNGKTVAVGSEGIAILGAKDAKTLALPPRPTSGVFEGETYFVGENGALVIGGKTFDRSSPTTAVLANGKTIEVGHSGIAIFKAEDVKTFALPSASSGVFEGETYSVGANGAIILGGKTFDRSSPTTAILSNGKTIEVGPSGIAIFGAKDARPSKTFAQPPARTGVFEGEAYSIGSNGIVIIGGKTFDRSSPTTAVLRNGKTVEVGPSGIAILGAKDGRPPSKTFAQPPARTGVFKGEVYSIGSNGVIVVGGKTFDRSSPTTAVLRNGKTVIVSPSNIAILPADDRITALPDQAKAYAATTGVLGGETFSAGTDGKIVIGGKTFDRSSPTSAILDNGKTVVIEPTSVAILPAQDSGSGPVKHYIAPKEYVLGAFVPVIVAVIFTVPWQILNAAVKEMEPFYQLQRDDGVTARNSLALEYRSSINIIATFTAIRKGHFLVWWSGLISIVAVALAPLATETVFIGFQGRCTPETGREACVPQLNVYPVAARVLQGILSFMALLTLALAWSLHRGKTGLRANAQSIAGLAALFQNKQVVEDFRRLNPHYTTSKMISSALRDNRYRIAAFFDEDGASAYGLVKCNHDSALMDPNYRTAFLRGKKYASVNVTATEDQERPKKHRTFSSYFTHKATIVIFGAFIAGLEALVIYYNQTGRDTGFERWMDSQSFGVAFLFTALGVLIKLFWTHLDDGKRD